MSLFLAFLIIAGSLGIGFVGLFCILWLLSVGIRGVSIKWGTIVFMAVLAGILLALSGIGLASVLPVMI